MFELMVSTAYPQILEIESKLRRTEAEEARLVRLARRIRRS